MNDESKNLVAPGLGEALSIKQVAKMLGCCQWTVRHKLMRQGLPHLRPSESGKLIFFKNQVAAWVIKRQIQQQGGIPIDALQARTNLLGLHNPKRP